MTPTVRQLMDDQAAGLVGRDDEMEILRQLLGEAGPMIVFVHGIAGIGKSALVGAFAFEARAHGATVLHLDGRTIEPTERGFLAALERKTGGDVETAEDAAARLSRLGDRVILIVDTYEVLRLLDPWLRQTFVPALTAGVRVVLAGREAPMTGWPSDLGGLFRGLPLENLRRDVAKTVLALAGHAGDEADRIYRLTRGHPLSLRLAASALAERPDLKLEAVTVKAIVEGLTELYLGVLDPMTREALDAASVVRRPTLSLLAAMLPDIAPQVAFDRLRVLAFVELSDDGLILHDTVREAIAALLRSSDPDRSKRYRAAAWRQLRDEVARASNRDMWRYTADLLYILENPIVREAFFPTTEHQYSVESATPEDGPAIAAIIARYESGGSEAALDAWWRLAQGAFRVARDRSGAVVGFYLICEMDSLSHRLIEADPVAGQCWAHLRSQPVAHGERVLFNRTVLARDHGDGPSPVQAAVWLDLKRIYMELRPHLRRVYATARDIASYGPMVVPLGFSLVPGEAIEFDGIPYYSVMNDFGPSSIDGWLTGLIASELQIDDDSILDVVHRQLMLDGRRVDLTKLEFEVISYLRERQGVVVPRVDLLRHVWGFDAGGSNVIEANVWSLRKKLGDQASCIETIRGLGYRFREPVVTDADDENTLRRVPA